MGCIWIELFLLDLGLARFHTLQTSFLLKNLRNRNGMVVARLPPRLLLYQQKLWVWLTKGGERNALDDFCNSVGFVVTGRGE